MVIYIAGKSKKKIIIDGRHFVKIIMYTQEVLNIYKINGKTSVSSLQLILQYVS
jgi:hypothetical protein